MIMNVAAASAGTTLIVAGIVIVLILAIAAVVIVRLMKDGKNSDSPSQVDEIKQPEKFPEVDPFYLSGNESIDSIGGISADDWDDVGVGGDLFGDEHRRHTPMASIIGDDDEDGQTMLLNSQSDKEYINVERGQTAPLFSSSEGVGNPGRSSQRAETTANRPRSIFYDDDADATGNLAQIEVPQSFIFRTSTEERAEINKPEFSIGKSRNADYTVVGNNTISRVHAVIIFKSGKFYMVDNHSSNKSFINGKQAEPDQMYPIKDQDEILIANEKFIFHTVQK